MGVVIPGRDLGTANDPFPHCSCPVCCDLLKDWLDCSKVDTRVTLNVNIECVANVIDTLEVIQSDGEWFPHGTSDKSPGLVLTVQRIVIGDSPRIKCVCR